MYREYRHERKRLIDKQRALNATGSDCDWSTEKESGERLDRGKYTFSERNFRGTRNISTLKDSDMNKPDSADFSSSHMSTGLKQPINVSPFATRPANLLTFNEHSTVHPTTANFNLQPSHEHRSPEWQISSRSSRLSLAEYSGLPGRSSSTTPTPSSAHSAALASASDASASHSSSTGTRSISPYAVLCLI
ncbi:hypothetical protein SISNIDRAFT_491017 [Sistotremastrum niveocremeum HHB9708]|uniref:Uncharacterized protein n=1 Tax=Sistotremastrum niveocremeum HHB9708 TaxID=1314777 RepID=A0A164N874_9AGAM|nr:hypothetical protein SISNIDRAFT_491017 [Sistotremastrum niveocremeum HHB9708]